MKYRKKPVIIEAVKWDGTNDAEIESFCSDSVYVPKNVKEDGKRFLMITTLEDGPNNEAKHVAYEGDWIIKGVEGEFYPCKPAIFEKTYELAS
jgi:hypothetical protein